MINSFYDSRKRLIEPCTISNKFSDRVGEIDVPKRLLQLPQSHCEDSVNFGLSSQRAPAFTRDVKLDIYLLSRIHNYFTTSKNIRKLLISAYCQTIERRIMENPKFNSGFPVNIWRTNIIKY